jgi:DNA (cytosine-5)-methyltransferase 1
MNNNKHLTVSEVADKIGVSPDTIRRWHKAKLIRGKRSSRNYRLFNLEEVQNYYNKITNLNHNDYKILKTNKKSPYTVVELFTGAGGTALGLENSGLKNILSVENDKNAIATLKENRPNWNIIHDDIANVDFNRMKADIIEGGFPCQSFSYAGKGLGFADIRGTLFFEFTRAIEAIKPKVIIGENVRGLASHDKGKTLKTMIYELDRIGYKVAYKILRSQYLDVPQKRERLIIIGIRKDLDLKFIFPKEKNYTITLREALKNVPKSEGQLYSDKKKKVLKLVPPGGYWRDLPLKIQKEYMMKSFYLGGGKTGMARRMSWDEPSLTLTTSPSQKQTERCHPSETRPFTVREYARIQTFPDDWIFKGSISSQYKQIGNAVPVNLGFHIGRCTIAMLNKDFDSDTMINLEACDLQLNKHD